MINIIISVKGLQKISDRLYIGVFSFKKNYYFQWVKVIPQYKVIDPCNYDRIVHNIEKNYAMRQDIGQTNGKMNLILKIKSCVIR